MNKCEHLHIMYDKINDYNYCTDCEEIFFEDAYTLENEDKVLGIDEIENNLEGLNNL